MCADHVVRYLESLARPDGGYAWEGQERSHLTPTFAVVGSYDLLRRAPPDRARVVAFVRSHHPERLKKLEQEHRSFELQQALALAWLGEEAPELREKVRGWTRPVAYMKAYERHGYPVFASEMAAIICRGLLGLPLEDLAPHVTEYLLDRRRANGTFNNAPAADGSDGHVVNTWWGLEASRVLGEAPFRGDAPGDREATVAWLRACQLAGGGFTYQPSPAFAGVDDVAYTRAAVRGLELLGAEPTDRDASIAYLRSLANADGGFADRPGWLSNPLATYRALDALDALGALRALDAPDACDASDAPDAPGALDAPASLEVQSSPGGPAPIRRRPPATPRHLPDGLEVFSIQIEAHGQGSPAEVVDLATALRIHLWGAKNARPGWIERAREIAEARDAPVEFFVSDEEYGTWVDVPGLGTYSHTSDIVAPAGRDIGASLADRGAVSWPEFRRRRLAPLVEAGGRLLWQFGENEELVRLLLDDSMERGGYAAISTFHFGNPDFTNSEPFLHRWRGRIPFIALADAHGPEPWWAADVTAGFRTLFLAREPTWEGWLHALERNWVVAVRHDAVSGFETWMHGGSGEVLAFVRGREREWRWWDHPEIRRPPVSLVAVLPTDAFEAGRPESGVTLRVRCAWECTPHGILRNPITELVKLIVDGDEVTPTLTSTRAARGASLADRYHGFHLPAPAPGNHTATVWVRSVAAGTESSRTIEFTV